MTAEQIVRLIIETFGEPPLAVTPLTFGHSSVSYDVTLPGRVVIVRTNENPAVFSGTAHNLSVLRELGLPVPSLIVQDLTQVRYSAAYMVLDKLPGHDLRDELGTLTRTQKQHLAKQIIGYQRDVATLPAGGGFGYAPIGEVAPFASWRDLVVAEISKDLPAELESPLTAWRERVFALTDMFAPYLEQVPPTCFLDDLTTKNVIVQDRKLSGLIDFDVVCYGDPLWTLGLTAAAIVLDLGPTQLDYVEELCRAYGLGELERAVVTWYAGLFALPFLAKSGPEETRRLQEALTTWLELLENPR